jgi:hypothetical protein
MIGVTHVVSGGRIPNVWVSRGPTLRKCQISDSWQSSLLSLWQALYTDYTRPVKLKTRTGPKQKFNWTSCAAICTDIFAPPQCRKTVCRPTSLQGIQHIHKHTICCCTTETYNKVFIFLAYNFSKEQYVLPEDDLRIETCRSVINVLV